MGCCSSTSSEAPLNNNPSSTANAGNSASNAGKQKGKEDKIELAFKAKRANVFTEGVDLNRNAFVKRNVPKTPAQANAICKFTKNASASLKNGYSLNFCSIFCFGF